MPQSGGMEAFPVWRHGTCDFQVSAGRKARKSGMRQVPPSRRKKTVYKGKFADCNDFQQRPPHRPVAKAAFEDRLQGRQSGTELQPSSVTIRQAQKDKVP